MAKTFDIWGIKDIEEIISDGHIFWKIHIRNPFKLDDQYQIGLNSEFFRKSWKRGVEKIILLIGEREIMVNMPSEKTIKLKTKLNKYEDKPSLFKDGSPMRIFHFALINNEFGTILR